MSASEPRSMQAALASILRDHTHLRRVACELGDLLLADRAPKAEVLIRLRWDLKRSLMQKLAFKDAHFYPEIERHNDPLVCETAARVRASIESLFSEYAAHAKSWTPERIEADWSAYQAEMRGFLSRLIGRFDHEEQTLFPLLGEGGASSNEGSDVADQQWMDKAAYDREFGRASFDQDSGTVE